MDSDSVFDAVNAAMAAKADMLAEGIDISVFDIDIIDIEME